MNDVPSDKNNVTPPAAPASDPVETKAAKSAISAALAAGPMGGHEAPAPKEPHPNEKVRYAVVYNPTIEAVINELFRLPSEELAKKRLMDIKDSFIISKRQDADQKKPSVRLWVRGYAITDEEKKQGYTGNYIVIRYKVVEDKFVLYGEKVPTEFKYHPQKKRPKQRHPDWGHPFLRNVQKKKRYHTIDEANAALQKFHEEYPEVSIPGVNKLYIMIYGKRHEGDIPVKKYILLVRAAADGMFFVDSKENNKTKKPAPNFKKDPVALGATEGDLQEPVAAEPAKKGYFTAMVELRKSNKRKPAARPMPPKTDGNPEGQ